MYRYNYTACAPQRSYNKVVIEGIFCSCTNDFKSMLLSRANDKQWHCSQCLQQNSNTLASFVWLAKLVLTSSKTGFIVHLDRAKSPYTHAHAPMTSNRCCCRALTTNNGTAHSVYNRTVRSST